MNQLGRIDIFLEVARRQSFAKAASALGMTGPAVSKQVIALEASLGVKLLHRTTRQVTLTEEGAHYYERARLAVEELKEAAAELSDAKAKPSGTIKLNAPLSFSHMHLLPVLSSFAKKYPDIHLDVSFDDRTVDVIAEGFDLVIRIGVMQDSSLIARHLTDCPIIMVASPKYLDKYESPAAPADLKQHRMIGYSYQGIVGEWKYQGPNGKTGSVKTDSIFKATTAEMMLQAALDGVGIAILPAFAVAENMKAGKLVRVLPDYQTYPHRVITAVMPPNRYRSQKVKLLLDWISSALKAMHVSV